MRINDESLLFLVADNLLEAVSDESSTGSFEVAWLPGICLSTVHTASFLLRVSSCILLVNKACTLGISVADLSVLKFGELIMGHNF